MKNRSVLASMATGLALIVASTGVSAEPPAKGRDFGAGVTLEQPTPLSELIAAPQRHAERPVLLAGRLTDLCTKKGCWTVLTDGEATVRVRFQDYGFFLPPDALGATALVQGVAETRTLSESEARHLAAESRNGDPASIHGPQRELAFVATGVRVLPPQ